MAPVEVAPAPVVVAPVVEVLSNWHGWWSALVVVGTGGGPAPVVVQRLCPSSPRIKSSLSVSC